MNNNRILVLDDEEIIRQLLKETLSARGYEVETAADGKTALELIKKSIFDLLITDVKMPGMSGLDVLREIKKTNPYLEVIVVTGYPTIEAAVDAIKMGAYDFICKPFDLPQFFPVVERCLDRQRLNIDRVKLNELNTLFELNRSIATGNTFDTILDKTLDLALDLVQAKSGAIFLFENKSLHLRITRGISGVIPDLAVPEKTGVLGTVRETVTPAMFNTEQDYIKVYDQTDPDPLAQSGLLRFPFLAVPLRSPGDVLGVLAVFQKASEDYFTERERILLSILSGQGAVAVENYRLYQQLRGKIGMLEQTIDALHTTQDQLIQTEKLVSIGHLASGVAHEIRNPLSIVLMGLEFLGDPQNRDEKIFQESVQKMKQSIHRANNIVVELLKFSRSAKLQLNEVSLCKVLDDTLVLLNNQARLDSIEIVKKFPADPVMIMADATMLAQAFFNLFANAVDAMAKGGTLTVDVSVCAVGSLDLPMATVKISDTGTGIAKENLSRIFNPFFTTKDPGKGTGLGLSIVHLILERHNGMISVESKENQGTTFTLQLPVKV